VLGILLGLGSAVAFAANTIVIRRGMLRISSNYIATLSVLTGFLFFLPIAGLAGDLPAIAQLSWKAYLFWSLSGIVHFALGRTWAYRSVQLLGANRSNIVTNLNPIVTIVLAVVILKETTTPLMIFGILLSLTGPLLIILKEQTVSSLNISAKSDDRGIDRRTLFIGMLYGIGAALFWGSSPIFIKFGFKNGGSAFVGSLLAYTAASAVISPSLILNGENRREILGGDRRSFQTAVVSGVASSIAQLFRYLALGYGSVIVISLIGRTMPVWVLLLSFFFNREYESFSRWVLIGNGLLMIGTILVVIP
jgi:drug/metabolite transporter, DME family